MLVAAFLLPVLLVLAAGSPVIRALRRNKCGQHIREDVAQHTGKEGTPTMGGLLLVGALVISVSILVAIRGSRGMAGGGVPFVLALTIGFAGIGLADDLLMLRRGRSLGLRARDKLALQFLLAGLFLFGLAHFSLIWPALDWPWGEGSAWLGWTYYPLAALLLVGSSNAVNLTDGLDGLATGLIAVAALSFGVVALGAGQTMPALFAICLAGACLGFAWFNVYPARIFMGDTGSLAAGAALGGLAIILHQEVLLLFFGAVFFLEALSVIMQVIYFKLTGRRIWRMSPCHHHFELSGWPEPKVVIRFWLTGITISLAALLSLPRW